MSSISIIYTPTIIEFIKVNIKPYKPTINSLAYTAQNWQKLQTIKAHNTTK